MQKQQKMDEDGLIASSGTSGVCSVYGELRSAMTD